MCDSQLSFGKIYSDYKTVYITLSTTFSFSNYFKDHIVCHCNLKTLFQNKNYFNRFKIFTFLGISLIYGRHWILFISLINWQKAKIVLLGPNFIHTQLFWKTRLLSFLLVDLDEFSCKVTWLRSIKCLS